MGLAGNNSTCDGCCTNTTRLCYSSPEEWEAVSPSLIFAVLLHWAGLSESSVS